MKFIVSMKNPDCVHEALDEAAKEMVDAIDGIDADEREALIESKREKLADLCGKWFTYMEYLDVEIDTEAKTCTVVPAR